MNTFEMDGLFTEEDIENRHTVIMQCGQCRKWTKQVNWLLHREYVPCENCGKLAYDRSSIKSLRTYNPLTDSKRRPGAKTKK